MYLETCSQLIVKFNWYHMSKLYIISKCITVNEESRTSVKQNFIIVIKY